MEENLPKGFLWSASALPMRSSKLVHSRNYNRWLNFEVSFFYVGNLGSSIKQERERWHVECIGSADVHQQAGALPKLQ